MSTRGPWEGFSFDSADPSARFYFALSWQCKFSPHPSAEACRRVEQWQGPLRDAPRPPLWSHCRCTIESVPSGSLLELARRERELRRKVTP